MHPQDLVFPLTRLLRYARNSHPQSQRTFHIVVPLTDPLLDRPRTISLPNLFPVMSIFFISVILLTIPVLVVDSFLEHRHFCADVLPVQVEGFPPLPEGGADSGGGAFGIGLVHRHPLPVFAAEEQQVRAYAAVVHPDQGWVVDIVGLVTD